MIFKEIDMAADLLINKEYINWPAEIKLKIRKVQIKAALSVNTELLRFYGVLGMDNAIGQQLVGQLH